MNRLLLLFLVGLTNYGRFVDAHDNLAHCALKDPNLCHATFMKTDCPHMCSGVAIFTRLATISATKNTLSTTLAVMPKEYLITFAIMPTDVAIITTNILHLTIDANTDKEGEYIPAVYMENDKLRICSFVNSVAKDCALSQSIALNKWVQIVISNDKIADTSSYMYTVFVDGILVAKKINPTAKDFDNVKVYLSNPWDDPFKGSIGSLRIMNTATHPAAWGTWTDWSECSVLCGEGKIERSRICENENKPIGQECSGNAIQRQNCYGTFCEGIDWQLQSKAACADVTKATEFEIQQSGVLVALKFTYTGSDKISCSSGTTKWGCEAGKSGIVVTDPNRNVIFPSSLGDDDAYIAVAGLNEGSTEIVYNPPTQLKTLKSGDKLNLWYGQKLRAKASLSALSGKSCYDIHAKIKKVEGVCKHADISYTGYTEIDTTDNIESWEECSKTCNTKSDCTHWTYYTTDYSTASDQKKCKSLKGSGTLSDEVGAISGSKDCLKEGPCEEIDVSYEGVDLETTTDVESWGACSVACRSKSGCKYWTWISPLSPQVANRKKCALKSTITKTNKNSEGQISGEVWCVKGECIAKGNEYGDTNSAKIDPSVTSVFSWEGCSKKCKEDNNCKFWTWYSSLHSGDKNTCQKFNKDEGKSAKEMAISGPLEASARSADCPCEEKGHAYDGTDLTASEKTTDTWQACRRLCADTANCVYWKWVSPEHATQADHKKCTPQSTKGSKQSAAGMISGAKECKSESPGHTLLDSIGDCTCKGSDGHCPGQCPIGSLCCKKDDPSCPKDVAIHSPTYYRCVVVDLDADLDGHWGDWTDKQGCSASCGAGNTKTRERKCDSPKPRGSGDQCTLSKGGTGLEEQEVVSTGCSTATCPVPVNCPADHPYVFANDLKCCKYPMEGSSSSGCIGSVLLSSSSCCHKNEETPCTGGVVCQNNDGVTTTKCPSDKPFAFSDGSKCCQYPMEKTDQGITGCDGGTLTYSSPCCFENAQEPCSSAVCQDDSEHGPVSCEEINIGYDDTTMTGGSSTTDSWQACADACAAKTGCKWWTWNIVGYSGSKGSAKDCLLKSSNSNRQEDTGRISGSRLCGAGKPIECDAAHPYVFNKGQECCSLAKDTSNNALSFGSTSCHSSGTVESCLKPPCINRKLSAWTAWTTECSAECGEDGVFERTRTCHLTEVGGTCSESLRETRRCNVKLCGVNGGWTNWGEWEVWSNAEKCGRGYRFKTRCCENPKPTYGGKTCEEAKLGRPILIEAYYPNPPCKLDGHWSTWGSFAACDPTCHDTKMTKTRLRECISPSPHFLGAPCGGESREVEDCPLVSCSADADAALTEWSVWTKCTANCYKYSQRCCQPASGSGSPTCTYAADDALKDKDWNELKCDRGTDLCPPGVPKLIPGNDCYTGCDSQAGECLKVCGYEGYCCKKDEVGCPDGFADLVTGGGYSCVRIVGVSDNWITTSWQKVTLVSGETTLTKNNDVTPTVTTIGKEYKVSFEVKLTALPADSSNIIHFTNDNADDDALGSRIPRVQLETDGKLTISAGVGTEKDYKQTHDVSSRITAQTWISVDITQVQDVQNNYYYNIVIDGNLIHTTANGNAKDYTTVKFYAPSNFAPAATGSIRNLVLAQPPE